MSWQWGIDRLNGEESHSLIHLPLSTYYMLGTFLNAGYPEVTTNPSGHEAYILVGKKGSKQNK